MPVDRGGLDYPITVRDEFSGGFDRFKKKAREARLEFAALKRELESSPSAAKTVVQNAEREAAAIERSSRALRRRVEEEKRLTRQEKTRKAALQQLNKEALRRETLEQKAILSRRQAFVLQRREASETLKRLKAEEELTRILNQQNRAQRILQAAQQRGVTLTIEQRRRLGLLTQAEKNVLEVQKARERQARRLQQAQELSANASEIQSRAELQALERINRARLQEARNAALIRQGRGDLVTGAGPSRPPERQINLFERLTRSILGTDSAANRVSFTFRRLFGILAAFTLVREAIAGFNQLVRTLLQASGQIEQAEIGIAAVVSSVGEVRDEFGNAVDAVKGLEIAQQLARRQTQLLRRDALTTTATFEELAEAFQVGLGPGLRAGLDVDQVRQFTRQVSLAAQAIGLEQRQLAEEIRSILGGTINIRQTRIAAVLGITNEDIRRAREAGNLFEFLQDRFAAFDIAGEKAADTFFGLVARVRDATRLLLTSGGVEFFESVKDLLRDILSSVVQINAETGDIELNDDLVDLVATVSEGLTAAVEQAQALREALSTGTGAALAVALSATLEVLANLVSGILEGIADGVALITSAVSFLLTIVQPIADFLNIDISDFRALAQIFATLLTLAVGLRLAIVGIRFVMGPLVSLSTLLLNNWRKIPGAIKAGTLALKSFRLATLKAALPIILAVALLGGIITLSGKAEEAVEGISDFVAELAGPILNGLDKALEKIEDGVGAGIGGAILVVSNALQELEERIENLTNDLEEVRDESIRNTVDFVADIAGDDQIRQITDSLIAAQQRAARESKIARQELIEVDARISEINKQIEESLVSQEEAQRDIKVLLEQRQRIQETINDLEQALVRTEIVRLQAVLSRINAETLKEVSLLQAAAGLRLEELAAIDAQAGAEGDYLALVNQRTAALRADLVAARLRRDVNKENLLIAQQELAIFEVESSLALAGLQTDIDRIDAAKRIAEERIAALEALRVDGELSEEQNNLLSENVDFLRRLNDLQDQLNQKLEQQRQIDNARLEELRFNQQFFQFIDSEPIAAGIFEGFATAFAEATDLFARTTEIILNGVRSLADTISSLLVDAFDPSTDANFQQRFGQFLKSLAQQIISTLLQIAITAAVLNALSSGILGATVGGFASSILGRAEGGPVDEGFAEGGKIPSRRKRAPRAFRRAKGFSSGGPLRREAPVRPSGLHPTDTIPIWAAAGEWVIKAKSVAKYGHDAMQQINAGLVDPMALRSLAGLSGSPRQRGVSASSSGPGYASGGSVSVPSGSGSTQSPGPALAVIAPSEEAVRRLFAGGGKAALLDVFSESAPEIRARLGIT